MVICRYEECTGCSACEAICPKKCITMIPDREGFLRPHINENICVECGMCKIVCEKAITNKNKIKECLVATNKSLNLARNSSSAGAFSVIIDSIGNKKIKVFGAAFDDNLKVNHIGIDERDISSLRGSKYVQSNLNNVFTDIKNSLEKEIYVVFSGTPCQVAGLKSYLKKDYENLLCIDLICHGVPSPMVFEKYKEFMEQKYKSKIVSINFGYKKYGWIDRKIKIEFENKKIYYRNAITFDDEYMASFFKHFIIRPSCYGCKYTTLDRCGDITLSDCWGVEKVYPDIKTSDGVSMILINTEKGKKISENLYEYMDIRKSKIEKFINYNPQLKYPASLPNDRDEAMETLINKGFKVYVDNYIKLRPIYIRLLSELKYKLKSRL